MNEIRSDPDALLRVLAHSRGQAVGRLKVFLGAAPGVGKTYEMLTQGAARRDAGDDVVVAVIETHGRAETEARLRGFEILPRKPIEHRGQTLQEMDLDAILVRAPALVLIDELAHTNAGSGISGGSRHDKRWQDVEEVLAAGIDVFSTLNVQHLESLNDLVASFTKVRVRETLPDRMLDRAEIEVVDIPPDELIERLKAGKVYVPQEASRALNHFFSKSNLSALRELALRRAAQTVDAQMLDHLRAHALAGAWAAGERVLVAVGADAAAPEVVRAGKRLADSLRAPWTAVHIETATVHADPESGKRLAAALQLASQLGGQLATVPAASVVEGVAHMAAELRASVVVAGTGRPRRWFNRDALLQERLVTQLVRAVPEIALHLIPTLAASGAPKAFARTGQGWLTWLWPPGIIPVLLLIALVTLAGTLISSLGNITNVALLYLLPVMLAATRYGVRSGVMAGLVSSLAYNFFFIPPIHAFTIADPQNIITVLVLLGVAVVSSQLAARLRAQAVLSGRSAAQNSALAGFARHLTGIRSREELGQVLCAEVARLLDVRAMLLLPQHGVVVVCAACPPDGTLLTLDQAAANWAFESNRPAGRGSDTLTASEWLFNPIAAGGHAQAVLGIAREDAGSPLRADQLPLLTSLLDQAGLALERIALEAEIGGIETLREQDRLRAALLSSVSHDLRTPLTSVLALLGDLVPASAEQEQVIVLARAEAERLQRFVANLLDMVRIESGGIALHPEPTDLAEAVASAAHDLRRTLEGRAVQMNISPNLPLALVDPKLFHHCLINLIENAAKYGAPTTPITISARRDRLGLDLVVMDEGPGLPPGSETRVFETFARLEGSDRKGGTGLGLAIVKGFAEAMGLAVRAANRSDRAGAEFTLRIDAAHLRTMTEEG